MKTKRNINIFFAIISIILGPSSLVAAHASHPPITWGAIGFIILGCLIGGLIVLGIQILRKNPKCGKYALLFFEPISIFILGSGVGVLVYSVYVGEFSPPSTLFLAMGVVLCA